jgi:hypothetical protein
VNNLVGRDILGEESIMGGSKVDCCDVSRFELAQLCSSGKLCHDGGEFEVPLTAVHCFVM